MQSKPLEKTCLFRRTYTPYGPVCRFKRDAEHFMDQLARRSGESTVSQHKATKHVEINNFANLGQWTSRWMAQRAIWREALKKSKTEFDASTGRKNVGQGPRLEFASKDDGDPGQHPPRPRCLFP